MAPSEPPHAQKTNGQRELDGHPLTPSIKTTTKALQVGAIISE
jgi:hypothetical protein